MNREKAEKIAAAYKKLTDAEQELDKLLEGMPKRGKPATPPVFRHGIRTPFQG